MLKTFRAIFVVAENMCAADLVMTVDTASQIVQYTSGTWVSSLRV
jgi:hypothetical protein